MLHICYNKLYFSTILNVRTVKFNPFWPDFKIEDNWSEKNTLPARQSNYYNSFHLFLRVYNKQMINVVSFPSLIVIITTKLINIHNFSLLCKIISFQYFHKNKQRTVQFSIINLQVSGNLHQTFTTHWHLNLKQRDL